MNTQQEMMRILHVANAYCTPPIDNGWELSEIPTYVTARHNATGRSFYFTLNPETKVIKAEAFCLGKPGSIAVYTGTITLGGRLIAPDMILALHTLFTFEFASDAVYVVEKNVAKLQRPANKKIKKNDAASDDLAVTPTVQSSSSYSRRQASRSKTSRFLRFFVYGESPFQR
jgi:hypothetical protein